MTKVRSIIEAASGYNWLTEFKTNAWRLAEAIVRFIATFDPEHVAAMNALCEADDPEPPRYIDDEVPAVWKRWRKRQDLRDALTALRQDRGLL